jgi:hypothetical protein
MIRNNILLCGFYNCSIFHGPLVWIDTITTGEEAQICPFLVKADRRTVSSIIIGVLPARLPLVKFQSWPIVAQIHSSSVGVEILARTVDYHWQS